MYRTILLACLGTVLALTTVPPTTLADEQNNKPVKLETKGQAKLPSVWMRQKLSISQQVFAGLTSGDMEQVSESARMLQLMNKIESFARGRSDAYRAQMKLFQMANREILLGAKAGNLERATLAYTQLTVSCVLCHKQLRRRATPK